MDNDLFTEVRGVRVPTRQIEEMKANYGAELVPDSEFIIIAALDRALKDFRARHGYDPERINLREDPFHWYRHMILNVEDPIMHIKIPVTHKPAYFRIKRIFPGVSLVS